MGVAYPAHALAGSVDFFYASMYRYHPTRYPVFDDYELFAVRSELNEYPATPGYQVFNADPNFASKFSIVFKFNPADQYRFTLLNVSDANGDGFSIVIDMIANVMNVTFADCEINSIQLPLNLSDLEAQQWHRIALAVDPSYFSLYVDCYNVYKYPIEHNCTVSCGSHISVLKAPNVIHVSTILQNNPFFKPFLHMILGKDGYFTVPIHSR